MLNSIRNVLRRRHSKDIPTELKGFWTDEPDAVKALKSRQKKAAITDSEADLLLHFIQHGYVILKGAINPEHADALVAEIAGTAAYPNHYIARTQGKSYSYVTPDVIEDKQFRLIDFHVNSELARTAEFAPAIQRFLNLLFEEPALAFQSLTFKYGSQQGIHQDGAYVVVDKPLQFVASWIALEDVTPGSGELIYYPGSHRFPHYLFGERHKNWLLARDGVEANQSFIAHLKTQIEETGVEEQQFSPSKGDALIWAADLVHGGAKITNSATRHSLVTHYCPLSVAPNYKKFFKQYAVKQFNESGFYSSRHYDLCQHNSEFEIGPEIHPEASSDLYTPVFMGTKIDTSTT
ncbi:MAG: phytanoyl-CoA dioxygenase family protein [Pseudomonadales bacterium]